MSYFRGLFLITDQGGVSGKMKFLNRHGTKIFYLIFYLYSENKGADQLRGNREADLRLCFRIIQKTGFHMTGRNYSRKYCNCLVHTVRLNR